MSFTPGLKNTELIESVFPSHMVFYKCVYLCAQILSSGFTIFVEEPLFSCICDMLSHYTTGQSPRFSSENSRILKYSTNLMKLNSSLYGKIWPFQRIENDFFSVSRDALNGPSLPVFTINVVLPIPFLFTFFVCFPKKKLWSPLPATQPRKFDIFLIFAYLSFLVSISLWCLSIIYSEWVP